MPNRIGPKLWEPLENNYGRIPIHERRSVPLTSYRRGSPSINIWIGVLHGVHIGMPRPISHSGSPTTGENIFRSENKHVTGKLNTAPDCTSRYPASPKPSKVTSIDTTQQIDCAVQASIISAYEHNLKLRAITWDGIVAAAATDEECRALAECIQNGFTRSHHELHRKSDSFGRWQTNCIVLMRCPLKKTKFWYRGNFGPRFWKRYTTHTRTLMGWWLTHSSGYFGPD